MITAVTLKTSGTDAFDGFLASVAKPGIDYQGIVSDCERAFLACLQAGKPMVFELPGHHTHSGQPALFRLEVGSVNVVRNDHPEQSLEMVGQAPPSAASSDFIVSGGVADLEGIAFWASLALLSDDPVTIVHVAGEKRPQGWPLPLVRKSTPEQGERFTQEYRAIALLEFLHESVQRAKAEGKRPKKPIEQGAVREVFSDEVTSANGSVVFPA